MLGQLGGILIIRGAFVKRVCFFSDRKQRVKRARQNSYQEREGTLASSGVCAFQFISWEEM